MPASLLYDFENPANAIKNSGTSPEEGRALAVLALELSLLGLDNDSGSNGSNSLFSSGNSSNHTTPPLSSGGHPLLNPYEHDSRFGAKRSQNTTECVPVPSSEHVAEIVGRQGCKIKALRAKTNTYIKTPVRGEEPVFVVTGRKEDVSAAKREILSAAEHFSQIRAQRKNNPGNMGPAPNAHLPGHITIQVRVPYRVVGLVVGPKGATIKRIQQQTNTYIITPSRDKDPVFEVTGLAEDVDTARKEIEAHIAIRTGGIIDSTTGSSGTPEESTSDFSNSPLMSSFDNPFSSNVYNNNFNNKSADLFAFPSSIGSTTNPRQVSTSNTNTLILNDTFTTNAKFGDMYSALFSSGSNSNSGKNTSTGSYDTDEGIGDSPTYDIMSGNNGLHSMWNELKSNTAHSSGYAGDFSNGSEYHRRSSSLESNIDSSNSSSAPAELSII